MVGTVFRELPIPYSDETELVEAVISDIDNISGSNYNEILSAVSDLQHQRIWKK